jgi:FtsP/CotA-like multicopper oxidase with cupredoxin domain
MKLRSATLLAAVWPLLLSTSAWAQAKPPANSFDCPATITGQPLATIPEIQASDRMLKGTFYTVSEQQMMTTPTNGPGSAPYCFPQWVRAYRRSAPTTWNPSSQQLTDPMPGPTLRARVGDVVALTFLNVIDANKFPGVDDNRCDETGPGGSIYPGPSGPGKDPDTYPDCFAGSVYTNVHYHGTHTNPGSTGDNVFVQIRPSPRKTGSNAPVLTAAGVQPAFNEFFDACRQQLGDAGPKVWPRLWSDLPAALQRTLMDPVRRYAPEWWTANQKLIANGEFPQYYVGAFPYCFKLPEYKTAALPAVIESPSVHTPHSHGAGESEVDEAKAPARPLVMGQAPGTHWYHAHKHGATTINVMNGMTGAFIIEGEYDDALNNYYGENWTRKQPVMVIQQLGAVPPLQTGAGGGPGPDFSVNGQLRPVVSMAGNSVQMWRIANTAGRAGVYFAAPQAPNGISWKQLAQDGVQFNAANYTRNRDEAFLLASGNRADLLVKAPPYNATGNNTYDVLVFNTIDPSDRPPLKPNVKPFTLMTVQVTANGPDMQFLPTAPAFPSFLSDVRDDEISGTKVINFASTPLGPPVTGARFPSQHTIDGKRFDGELGVVVALNRAEEWKIVNETYPPANANWISHPFHIHINPFQVTEVFDPNATLSTTDGKGTVSVTKIAPTTPPATKPPAGNQATVTGSGTYFTREFHVGDWIWVNSSQAADPTMGPSMVSSIASDTEMIIDNAPGAGGKISAGATYKAVLPLYTIDRDHARPGQCVLDPNDAETWKPCSRSVPKENRIWRDVFSIPSGSTFADASGKTVNIPGYFKMRSRFVDYAGYYVIHCHILAHEDRGMMTVVEVAPLQTPYSHH